jgi:hypothetical protein
MSSLNVSGIEVLEELRQLIKRLDDETKKMLLRELQMELGKRKRPIPEEAKPLIEEYANLMVRLQQIRHELRVRFGITPRGRPIRDEDYRNIPAFRAVLDVFRTRNPITVEEFEREIQKRGYKGLTGTVQKCLSLLKRDGLLIKEGSVFHYKGE